MMLPLRKKKQKNAFLLHKPLILKPDPNQGKIILRSENNDNPCEGHVEVYYGNEMGHVGDKNWNEKTDEVVCRSTHCGRPVRKSNVYRAFNSTVWLNELECKGDEASLWDCDGWPGPKVSFYRKPTVKKITCSCKSLIIPITRIHGQHNQRKSNILFQNPESVLTFFIFF